MNPTVVVYALAYLIPASYVDIKKHSIDIRWLVFMIIPLPAVMGVAGMNILSQDSAYGALLGVIFIIISLVTGGAVGLGDAVVIAWLGVIFGIIQLVKILVIAWFVAFLVGIARILSRSRREIPFLPCILVGVLVGML